MHGPGPAEHPRAQARTAAPSGMAGGAGQGVLLDAVAQAGYAGLRQLIADGVVHRSPRCGLWAVFPRIRLIDTSLPVSGFACQ